LHHISDKHPDVSETHIASMDRGDVSDDMQAEVRKKCVGICQFPGTLARRPWNRIWLAPSPQEWAPRVVLIRDNNGGRQKAVERF
jgi:hypothetical protein